MAGSLGPLPAHGNTLGKLTLEHHNVKFLSSLSAKLTAICPGLTPIRDQVSATLSSRDPGDRFAKETAQCAKSSPHQSFQLPRTFKYYYHGYTPGLGSSSYSKKIYKTQTCTYQQSWNSTETPSSPEPTDHDQESPLQCSPKSQASRRL